MVRTLAFLIFAVAAVFPASATPTDGGHGAYHEWFGAQVIPPPDPAAGTSCCAESDGHIIEEEDWRIASGRYEVRIGTDWIAIPDTRVLPNTRNPTGHPVVWYTPGPHIFCFAPGTVS